MEKAASNGQFRNLVGSLNMMPEDAISKINGVPIQKAIDELGSGVTQTEFIKWINNGCRLNKILANAFTVGDIFHHRAEEGDRRLWLSENTQSYLKPYLKKVIPIRTDFGKLSEYCLPNNMNDSSIQKNAGNPGLVEFETFLCVMYLLIFVPELGKQVLGYTLRKDKWYLFHVMIDGKKVAFAVYWLGVVWRFDTNGFGSGRVWSEGTLFLSFATA